MIKKITPALLCVVLISLLMPLFAFSGNTKALEIDGMYFKFNSVNSSAGLTETIRLEIGNNSGIVGTQFEIETDKGISVVSCELSGEFLTSSSGTAGNFRYNKDVTPNILLWTAPEYKPVSSDGVFAILKVKVDENTSSGIYGIRIVPETAEAYDKNLQPVKMSFINGAVNVNIPVTTSVATTGTESTTTTCAMTTTTIHTENTEECTTTRMTSMTWQTTSPPVTTSSASRKAMDMNNDGKVDIFDLQQFINAYMNRKLSVVKGDLDGNGSVTIGDVIFFSRYILAK